MRIDEDIVRETRGLLAGASAVHESGDRQLRAIHDPHVSRAAL
jgi:hypothetical protein